jgi:hypothetical protein
MTIKGLHKKFLRDCHVTEKKLMKNGICEGEKIGFFGVVSLVFIIKGYL